MPGFSAKSNRYFNQITLENKKGNKKTMWVLAPLFGSLLFSLLYIVATWLYPGGSQADKNAAGFSWVHNYWCNLLNTDALNGKPNPARPVALMAMFVLCLSFSFFFYLFPQQAGFKKRGKRIIQISGITAMAVVLFLFTPLHDAVINLAGLFGTAALTGVFIGLYNMRWHVLFWFGLFNLFLVALNNYVYYTAGLIFYLPVIQKISFLSFLLWVCFIDVRLYRR